MNLVDSWHWRRGYTALFRYFYEQTHGVGLYFERTSYFACRFHPPIARQSAWYWIGRFTIAYLASLAVSAVIVPMGVLLTSGSSPDLMAGLFTFAFRAIGIFAFPPAILVFLLVLWLRLRPMRSIVISAGLVGLVGAVMLETNFFTEFGRPSTNFAFIAAMAVCGLVAGLVFWFIAFRPPRAADETAGS